MGKGGQKSETSKQAPSRKTKAAVDRRQNNRMLRQCPSGIAQRPPHHVIAVPTAIRQNSDKEVGEEGDCIPIATLSPPEGLLHSDGQR